LADVDLFRKLNGGKRVKGIYHREMQRRYRGPQRMGTLKMAGAKNEGLDRRLAINPVKNSIFKSVD
jgi:hypothetical protein